MSRKIEEIQEDIRTLTRVPSMFINAKLYELAEEVGQIRADAIDEMKTLIFQFDDYCDGMECSDCWMNEGDSSCLKLWIDRKFEQLKEQKND